MAPDDRGPAENHDHLDELPHRRAENCRLMYSQYRVLPTGTLIMDDSSDLDQIVGRKVAREA